MKAPAFYRNYIELVKDKDLIAVYNIETIRALKFYNNIDNNKSLFRYEKGKWSIRELLGHVCDSEQIFVFRILSILRNEKAALPGFDENEYVAVANFDQFEWSDLIKRFELMRAFHSSLFAGITKLDFSKYGNANGNDISIEALIAITICHELHHRNFIGRVYL